MITDVRGDQLEINDVVFRAKYSAFIPHKVLGFTNKSIKLSCERIHKSNYSYMNDNKDLSMHNESFYFPKRWAVFGLIKL